MNVFVWHVHGSWMTAFVQGEHTYYVPVVPDRGPEGRGRAQTWDWPANVVEVDRATAATLPVDVVVLQRPIEAEWTPDWLGGRVPGRDVPAVYVEHDTPRTDVPASRHPFADRDSLTIAHVTHFNDVFWDCGSTRVRVIEHGVVDPGYHYTGELARTAAVINEARRRGRVAGTDLLARFGRVAPIDLFGMDAAALGGIENLPQAQLFADVPRRRVYLHPYRWTSLGLSLLEAMLLGMPVVALGTTEAFEAVPPDAGVVSTDIAVLLDGLERFHRDPAAAREAGRFARAYARERYGVARFLRDWDALLGEVCA
jgi:glycosyltransferase involved in cell wall biosynthesis